MVDSERFEKLMAVKVNFVDAESKAGEPVKILKSMTGKEFVMNMDDEQPFHRDGRFQVNWGDNGSGPKDCTSLGDECQEIWIVDDNPEKKKKSMFKSDHRFSRV